MLSTNDEWQKGSLFFWPHRDRVAIAVVDSIRTEADSAYLSTG